MYESILHKLKKIKIADILHIFLFLFALIPAMIYKRLAKDIILLCEYAEEAHDNAYWLFKYINEYGKSENVFYVIKSTSKEYDKVKKVGKVIEFGSLKHWIYYLSAKANVSSQKGGKPNAAVCYLFEVVFRFIKTKNVFLQHGVTINDLPYLHADHASIDLFVCSAQKEYDFIIKNFGYEQDKVKKLGMCRFDSLKQAPIGSAKVLIAPTWRNWLISPTNTVPFTQSNYFLKWQELLNNKKFINLIEKNKLEVYFYLHMHLQEYLHFFASKSKHVSIINWQDKDLQALMNDSIYMMTDFSSSVIDFSYTDKRIVYYQFDYDDYREKHQPFGYFSYENDGFGPVCYSLDALMTEFDNAINDGFVNPSKYTQRINDFFIYRDNKNCERTYYAIKELIDA